MNVSLEPISRRNVISRYAPAAIASFLTKTRLIAQNPPSTTPQAPNLISHPRGQFFFIRGIPAYSAGAVARRGYEIVHVTFSRPRSMDAGFQGINEHFTEFNIPRYGLCALELRSPLAVSSDAFRTFNSRYIEALRSWNILLGNDVNPIARTNVVPVLFPPDEPGIRGFSYLAPSKATERTFIVAGGGELPDGSINAADIFRRGETTPAALLDKARYVMTRMRARIHAMEVNWTDATSINVYTAHDLTQELMTEVLGETGRNDVTWNYAHPPIKDLEFEMDLRGVKREFVL